MSCISNSSNSNCSSNCGSNNSCNSNNNNNGRCGSGGNSNSGSLYGKNRGPSFLENAQDYIGETVTVFTSSGGAAGCGFTGVLISVNQSCLRLVTGQGAAPSNPLAENVCCNMSDDYSCRDSYGDSCGGGGKRPPCRPSGSVCYIPIDHIVAFCHNAL